jgi:hypothetical protein
MERMDSAGDRCGLTGSFRDRREAGEGRAATIIPWRRKKKMAIGEEQLRERLMGSLTGEVEELLEAGRFGAVFAHAGIGKTALMVQLAIRAMLRGRNVLHVSLHDPVQKVALFYEELFHDLTRRQGAAGAGAQRLWESLVPLRFIMTFRVDGFSVPRLEERMGDLAAQGIFRPGMVVIDGFPFEETSREDLAELKKMAGQNSFATWFTVHTHRYETPEADGIPRRLQPVAALFDIILEMEAERAGIRIRSLKGAGPVPDGGALLLDPATMLVRKEAAGG